MTDRAWRHKKDPWMPADYDDQVVWAARALSKGEALAHQQKLIWDWLAYVGGVGDEWQDLAFRPGPAGDRDTTFAAGKQFPVLQLRKMLRPELTPRQPQDTQPKSANPLPSPADKMSETIQHMRQARRGRRR